MSFQVQDCFQWDGTTYFYSAFKKLPAPFQKKIQTLPYAIKILLENLLRYQENHIDSLIEWSPAQTSEQEILFHPTRIVLQDFTGVPSVVDLAAMRDAYQKLGGDPKKINPLQQADLVIDHSVQVDFFGDSKAFERNVQKEFKRNQERYALLKWAQKSFQNFQVVPPGTGIIHQVNLEFLSKVAYVKTQKNQTWVFPDSLIGTDSHTTMINALGVLGWGVGGIEAEAAMLGQPISMLIPQVVGVRLEGSLQEGMTATDLVLTLTRILRKKGVVGKIVEFFGPGVFQLTLEDRATLSNMSPEFGATASIFPVDHQTTAYLRKTNREKEAQLVEKYFSLQNLWYRSQSPDPSFSELVEVNLDKVTPAMAGPSRPQDRFSALEAKKYFQTHLPPLLEKAGQSQTEEEKNKEVLVNDPSHPYELSHGSVVIAAITSCTNTSNPSGLITAALVAKNAISQGLQVPSWVKTSFAPGSTVAMHYLQNSHLYPYLAQLGFDLVGYGCTTCIGNSGPLSSPISEAIKQKKLVVASVLSGNRNFEGRIHPLIRANYLASPGLVVAYALAGTIKINLKEDPIGKNQDGKEIFLKDIWPRSEQVQEILDRYVKPQLFQESYKNVFEGEQRWKSITISESSQYKWDHQSTYIQNPPFFKNLTPTVPDLKNIDQARVLALLGDSITTDHISPAGAIPIESASGAYLQSHGVLPQDFNSFGSRRGNHEVMMRGTFANIRLKNKLAPGTEGGWTTLFPEKKVMTIFDASTEYQKRNTPLIVLAGKEYGTGSSRDWAAKGTALLGVKAVIAESFERIHRSNLIGMGVLPLEFINGENIETLKLTGHEIYNISGIESLKPKKILQVTIKDRSQGFQVRARIDTANELMYYQHQGILSFVLRKLYDEEKKHAH